MVEKKNQMNILWQEKVIWNSSFHVPIQSFVGTQIMLIIYVLSMADFLFELAWWLGWWSIPLQCRRPGFDPWVGKIPWMRVWQLTLVSLPGETPWTEEPDWAVLSVCDRDRMDHKTSDIYYLVLYKKLAAPHLNLQAWFSIWHTPEFVNLNVFRNQTQNKSGWNAQDIRLYHRL